MDINRLALYLSWKLPPYYRPEYDRLKLIEKIRALNYNTFTEDLFKIIDSSRFYSICLNRLDEKQLEKLVDWMN